MYKRLLVFLFCLLGGALAGGLAEFEWHFERGSLVGVIVGVLAWLGVDLYGASQLLNYLRSNGRDDHGKLIAGISLSTPSERFNPDWAPLVRETANEISRALGYLPASA